MIIELQPSVMAEIVLDGRLSALPRWGLKYLSLMVGPFSNGNEHERYYLETVGSGDTFRSAYDEFRFNQESLELMSVWFHVPEENLASGELLDGWRVRQPVSGTLRLRSPLTFLAEPTTMRWMESDGKFLAGVHDRVLDQAEEYLRLCIAQDLDLLIADNRLCGWMLSNPTRYLVDLWEEPDQSEPEAELGSMVAEFLAVVHKRQLRRLMEKDPALLAALTALRARLGHNQGHRTQCTVFREAIDDVIERFYGQTPSS